MYYVKASSILLQKNVSDSDRRALRRLQSGNFAPDDIAVVTRLSGKYKKEVNGAMRNVLDPAIQEKFSEIKDQEIRNVIIAYYKGIWDWI